ncbi:MAG: dihydropteroate synthase [Rhodospirillaceae bacterium]|nr:dihydropteroate synthase [Rhodospirillaceae bacterium]|tara:strand:- start:8539 stop:9612 length:1074 start_codon:yes stop_codon:yes gene_type:complete
MNINRSPGFPRGFAYDPKRLAEIQLRPKYGGSGSISRAELYLPVSDSLEIIDANVTDITDWADDIGGDLARRISDLLKSATKPNAEFAGLPLSEPLLIGVINVTPDSFHDGGRYDKAQGAIAQGVALINAGAKILDIGGESTRPGADPVSVEEEIARVVPVIEHFAAVDIELSVDTRRPEVMKAGLVAGAKIVNDVTALQSEGAIEIVRDANASAILMHMKGQPQTMQQEPYYDNAPYEVARFLEGRVEVCEQRGLSRDRLAIDPGIGFGKLDRHNFELLQSISMLHGFGVPVALGVSRKSFIGRVANVEDTNDRLPGTVAATLYAITQNVQIHRVHDVAEIKQALTIWHQCQENAK